MLTLNLPSLPAGTDGFNVYRRAPGEARFLFLASIDMTVATPPEEYEDDGSVEPDCNRPIPTRNTTADSNTINITIPGATPAVPDNCTWRLYRTYVMNDWNTSLLDWIVEEVEVGSGIITTEYSDVGSATSIGSPPSASQISASPSKIVLTDAEEVEGSPPPGLISHTHQVTFSEPGSVEVREGTGVWTCEFDSADILHVRAYLGRDSVPSDDIQVDVLKWTADDATPDWESIFLTTPYPKIETGENDGGIVVPDTTRLSQGDKLTIDILASDEGSATPTSENLHVNILLMVNHGSESTSYDWS